MTEHLSEQPARKIITADGHDVAGGHSTPRWRTPSGQMLVEGKQYEIEWRYVFVATKITESYELLRYRCQRFVVSEALEKSIEVEDARDESVVDAMNRAAENRTLRITQVSLVADPPDPHTSAQQVPDA